MYPTPQNSTVRALTSSAAPRVYDGSNASLDLYDIEILGSDRGCFRH